MRVFMITRKVERDTSFWEKPLYFFQSRQRAAKKLKEIQAHGEFSEAERILGVRISHEIQIRELEEEG